MIGSQASVYNIDPFPAWKPTLCLKDKVKGRKVPERHGETETDHLTGRGLSTPLIGMSS